jgi:hypothetical protein
MRMRTSILMVASCFHIAHISKYLVSTAECRNLNVNLDLYSKI